MRVRIISGKYGGRFIATPNSSGTHPMGERVRSAVFNSLVNEVTGANVLDAFAGSGAVGLEALSRGCENVVFVEKNRVASKIIRENCSLLEVDQNDVKIINTTVVNWIENSEPDEFDLIFADPPYHNLQLSTVKMLMGKRL